MKSYPIYDAGMGIHIINNNVVSAYKGINSRNHSLVTEIQ